MNHRHRYQRYKELELISDSPIRLLHSAKWPHAPKQPPRTWLGKLWEILDAALVRDLEGRIWHSTDAQTGQTRWHFYNPDTGKTHHLSSDAEVRQWLQQMFDHSPG